MEGQRRREESRPAAARRRKRREKQPADRGEDFGVGTECLGGGGRRAERRVEKGQADGADGDGIGLDARTQAHTHTLKRTGKLQFVFQAASPGL